MAPDREVARIRDWLGVDTPLDEALAAITPGQYIE